MFYVFPFTTLITQTYASIKKTLELDDTQIVQLHSKAKYNEKNSDGIYGDQKTNFLDNQFMNYPITLLSHVKFFDILTGISKDDNYIFHRLANSIVIIDEIQTYSPDFWSQIVYLLDMYAKNFNIKFIVMSATLPKIGKIIDSQFIFLVSKENKKQYFQNPNFAKRVEIITKVIEINEFKYATSLNLFANTANSYLFTSKIESSAKNSIVVPVFLGLSPTTSNTP